MKKQLLVLLCAFLVSGNAFADTLKGGYPVCFSEDLFSQMVTALAKEDAKAYDYLMKSGGCGMAEKGTPISVLGTTWGTAKVRAYGDDSFAVIVWTYTENIVRSK